MRPGDYDLLRLLAPSASGRKARKTTRRGCQSEDICPRYQIGNDTELIFRTGKRLFAILYFLNVSEISIFIG